MEVLVVAPYVPFEGVTHAGGAFLLQHVRALGARGRVSLMVCAGPRERAEAELAPADLELVLATARRGSGLSPGRQVDRLGRRLWPGQLSRDGVRGLLDAGLVERARRADAVELHWPEYAVLATVLRRHGVTTPIAVVEHDVDAQAVAGRLRGYGSVGQRLRHALLGGERARQERRHLSAADAVLVFKDADVEVLRGMGVRTRALVIDPFLVQPSTTLVERTRGSVLFTGALWRQENASGCLWFLREVWPTVARAVPHAGLVLVGAAPSPELERAAARTPGARVVGDVPDLDPWYRSAEVFVAPLFVPGGLKFKVPQAMVYGLPVVATTTAAAGVVEQAPPDTFWAVTDEPGAMAAALVRALTSAGEAAETGERAARWARARYGPAGSTDRVLELYRALRRGGA